MADVDHLLRHLDHGPTEGGPGLDGQADDVPGDRCRLRDFHRADLAERARIIMEKPFGRDLASSAALNHTLHETFDEHQIFRIDHFLGKEAALNILAFRFANGLFEPIWNRQHIAHVQIDVPETLSLGHRTAFYERTGAYRDMVVNHLFQVLAFMAMEPPTALEPTSIGEEKNKVFRSLAPIEPAHVVRGQYSGYLDEPGVHAHSDTETFIALRCEIDNWRWAGVPFYLRTGKRMAEGARIISIAFREPPKSMFPSGSGVGAHGPDHLTFDLADASKLSLSFYGKRPGPGMKLDKQSLQFALHETGRERDVLGQRRAQGCGRNCVHDNVARGDHGCARRPCVHEGHLAGDLTTAEASDLAGRLSLLHDQLPVDQDVERLHGNALVDQNASLFHALATAVLGQPLDVGIRELTEDEQHLAHDLLFFPSEPLNRAYNRC